VRDDGRAAHTREIRLITTLRLAPRGGKSLDLNFRHESKHRDRYSTVSYSETGASPSQAHDASTTESFANPGGSRPRYDSNQLLTLPAPLALSRPTTTGGSSTTAARSSEDVYSDNASSRQHLVSSPTSNATEQLGEDYHGTSTSTPARRPSPHQSMRTTGGHGAIRQMTSPMPFPGETVNPFQSSHDNYGVEHDLVSSGAQSRLRGVSLSDNGPVPGPEGVRRISRPSARRTSQQNRYSRTTSTYVAAPDPSGGSS
jgi:chitin synthase